MPTADHSVFDELMPNKISRYKATGYDKNGKPTWAATFTSYSCFVDDNIGITRNVQMERVQYSRKAYVNNDGDDFGYDDKFVFQDGTTRPLISIRKAYDYDGVINNITLAFE
jgi:hypothetical protein